MGCSSTKRMEPVRKFGVESFGFHDAYDLGQLLGAGTYGAVFSATRVDSGEVCAVKVVDLSQTSGALETAFGSEQKSWTRAGQHPNIVSLLDWRLDDAFGYFVMELCQVTVGQAWVAEQELNELTYAKYFIDMLKALGHLHSVGLVHRDVKHENFLVDTRACPTVKLCDFGFACSSTDRQELIRQCGTVPYMAPEVLQPHVVSRPASDVWSLGVVVYICFCFFGKWPYCSQEMTRTAMANEIRSGARQPLFRASRKLKQGAASGVAIEFVKAMLVRDANARSSAAGCLEMDYILQFVGRGAEDGICGLSQQSLKPVFHKAVDWGIFARYDPQKKSRIASLLMDQQARAKTRQRQQSTRTVQHTFSSNEVHGRESDASRPSTSNRRREQIPLKKQGAISPDEDHGFDGDAFGAMANNRQPQQSALSVKDDSLFCKEDDSRPKNSQYQQRAWNVQHECVYVEDGDPVDDGIGHGEAVQGAFKPQRGSASGNGKMIGIVPDAANTFAPHSCVPPQFVSS